MREGDKCGWCGVGVFTPPLGCPLLVDHRSHSNCGTKIMVGGRSFSPLPRLIPPRTRPTAIPLRRRRLVCWLLFLHGAPSCYPLCLLTFSDNLYCQMILGVLIYRQSDVRALLNIQPSRVYLFTKLARLLVFCMITESFFHLSVPTLHCLF